MLHKKRKGNKQFYIIKGCFFIFETLFPIATLTSHFFTLESMLHHIMFKLSETDADGFTLQVHETLACLFLGEGSFLDLWFSFL